MADEALTIGTTWVFEIELKQIPGISLADLRNWTVRFGCVNENNVIKKIFQANQISWVSDKSFLLRIDLDQTNLAKIGSYNYVVEMVSPDGSLEFPVVRDKFKVIDELIKTWG